MNPKPGDIVKLKGWGGVVGEVVEYHPESKTMLLTWPHGVFWPGGDPQPFGPVEPDDFKVLTAQEVLRECGELLYSAVERLSRVTMTRAAQQIVTFRAYTLD